MSVNHRHPISFTNLVVIIAALLRLKTLVLFSIKTSLRILFGGACLHTFTKESL